MSVWELLAKSLDTILLSMLAVIMAVLGRAAKLFHEESRGGQKMTVRVLLSNLPDAIVCGIIALGVTYTAAEYFRVPIYAGIALGGTLGHLGIQTVSRMLGDAASRFLTKKAKGDDS